MVFLITANCIHVLLSAPIKVKPQGRGEGSGYPQGFDCEVCLQGGDFDPTRYPQGGEFDMTTTLDNEEDLHQVQSLIQGALRRINVFSVDKKIHLELYKQRMIEELFKIGSAVMVVTNGAMLCAVEYLIFLKVMIG